MSAVSPIKIRTKLASASASASASPPESSVSKLPSFSPEFIMFIHNECIECYGDYYEAMQEYMSKYSEGTPMIKIIADLFAKGKPLHHMYINFRLEY